MGENKNIVNKEHSIMDYSMFNEVLLIEVENFFPKAVFKNLTDNGITSLGELFTKEANGELIKIFINQNRKAFEMWRVVVGTINILKCKYLNTDPEIYEYMSGGELADKLGIMRRRSYAVRSLNIASLMTMVEKNDFTELYRLFSVDKTNEIINKVRVIYEFRKSKLKSISNDDEISLEELNRLHQELKQLVDKYQEIGSQIAIKQAEIAEKTQTIKKCGAAR